MNTPCESIVGLTRFRGLLLLAGAIAATGCADKSIERLPRVDTRPLVGDIHQAELDWAWIAAQQWELSAIEGTPPIPHTAPWIRFREHTWLEGHAGCNRFTASYQRRAESGLRISEIMTTRMFCASPEGVMQQEARLLHLLQQTDAYHALPDRLDLLSDGEVVLRFVLPQAEDDRSNPAMPALPATDQASDRTMDEGDADAEHHADPQP